MAIYDRYGSQVTARDYMGHPVVYWEYCRNEEGAVDIVSLIVEECLRHIAGQLKFEDMVCPETVILAALREGGYHARHADNCRQNERGVWVANHTPHRDASAICYLNEDFVGGEIFFETMQVAIRPKRGLLLVFPSDAEHVHEVLPVRSGIRYTLPIWFTKQKHLGIMDLPPLSRADKSHVA